MQSDIHPFGGSARTQGVQLFPSALTQLATKTKHGILAQVTAAGGHECEPLNIDLLDARLVVDIGPCFPRQLKRRSVERGRGYARHIPRQAIDEDGAVSLNSLPAINGRPQLVIDIPADTPGPGVDHAPLEVKPAPVVHTTGTTEYDNRF